MVKKTTFIYLLIDPITNQIRYIGKANNPKDRYKNHINKCLDKNTHKRNWINKLKKLGYKPELEILEEVSISEWKYWESFWIGYYKYLGFKLLNYTLGGDGSTFGNKTSFKKGLIPWNTDNRPIYKIDLDGNILEEYESLFWITKNLNINLFSLDKIGKTTKKFIWFRKEKWDNYTKEEKEDIIFKTKTRRINNGTFKNDSDPWNKGVTGYSTTKKGQTIDLETRNQISKTLTGQTNIGPSKKLMQICPKTMKIIKIFPSLAQAKREGFKNLGISTISKTKYNDAYIIYKEFIWEYEK